MNKFKFQLEQKYGILFLKRLKMVNRWSLVIMFAYLNLFTKTKTQNLEKQYRQLYFEIDDVNKHFLEK